MPALAFCMGMIWHILVRFYKCQFSLSLNGTVGVENLESSILFCDSLLKKISYLGKYNLFLFSFSPILYVGSRSLGKSVNTCQVRLSVFIVGIDMILPERVMQSTFLSVDR